MSNEIKLLELPDQPTLVMRSIMAVEKLPEFFGKAYGGIMEYLGELGEYPAGMPFAAYHNLDMNALDVEAGFPVATKFEGKGAIMPGKIPAGKYASTIYVGPYDSVKVVYDALVLWAKENGCEPSDIAYEYYLNDPTSDPLILSETEVRFQLK